MLDVLKHLADSFEMCRTLYSFEMCRTLYDLKTTAHNTHTPTLWVARLFEELVWLVRDASNTIWLSGWWQASCWQQRGYDLGTVAGAEKLIESDKSDTMLDHACVWTWACVWLLVAMNSHCQMLPSHIYHRSHQAYSTHSVNTQYTLSKRYSKHTVNTCKNWEIWSMWVLTYSTIQFSNL